MSYEPERYRETPLLSPSSDYIQRHLGHINTSLSAYTFCYNEEQRLIPLIPISAPSKTKKPLIHVRILGWMFVFTRTDYMLVELSKSVLSCNGLPEKYHELGRFFLNFWIRPFRKYKGRTPNVSGHVSRPSFDHVAEAVKVELEPSPKDHSTAKANALIRDGYRCILTGRYDKSSVMSIRELRNQMDEGQLGVPGVTRCAHIIPSSTNLDIETCQKKENYAANAWAVLQRFGYGDMFQALNGPGIHCMENVFTLHSDYHDSFDTLQLWFEPLGENRYKIGTIMPIIFQEVPREITLTNHMPNHLLSMPSERYLALHTTCAKVANMSAAAEYLDELDRDRELGTVLASDGSSMDLVNHAFWRAMGGVHPS